MEVNKSERVTDAIPLKALKALLSPQCRTENTMAARNVNTSYCIRSKKWISRYCTIRSNKVAIHSKNLNKPLYMKISPKSSFMMFYSSGPMLSIWAFHYNLWDYLDFMVTLDETRYRKEEGSIMVEVSVWKVNIYSGLMLKN